MFIDNRQAKPRWCRDLYG